MQGQAQVSGVPFYKGTLSGLCVLFAIRSRRGNCITTIEMKLAILLVVGVIAKVYGDEPEAIVGGQRAWPGQFPHQISLQYYGQHICGGSIIGPTHILTAAHCVAEPKMYPDLKVVTGASAIFGGDGEKHDIKCIQSHSGYRHNTGKIDYDIAVITLTKPITFTTLQKPIDLASKDYSVGGNRAIVSGWGLTAVRSNVSPFLNWVEANVLSTSECQNVHSADMISKNQICIYETPGKGACQGDSGGPLISNKELIGVVSWGIPCAVGKPDVFTNVNTFKGWIHECQQKCP